MNLLTSGEEKLMLIIWRLKTALVHEIINEIEGRKPAYNTVSTVLKILERKKFLGHKAYGKTYQYYAVISKDDCMKFQLEQIVTLYFEGSTMSFSTFVNGKLFTK